MHRSDGELVVSAVDLGWHAACEHRTIRDFERAAGRIKPMQAFDASLQALRERGQAHEDAFVRKLEGEGRRVVRVEKADWKTMVARTVGLMRDGADVIAQAALWSGSHRGQADVLLRVPRASALGQWSYEPLDTKLAKETRAATILQLCVYCDLLLQAQGVLPEYLHVVPPGDPLVVRTERVRDYFAYYTHVKAQLGATIRRLENLPPTRLAAVDPTPHCDICDWSSDCDAERRNADHLSLIAGITKLQRKELVRAEVSTMTAFAELPTPLTLTPEHGDIATYNRPHHQARLQLASRGRHVPLFERLPVEPGRGLARLPAPSAGDLFLDFEGDPFVGLAGIEYLTGLVRIDGGAESYECRWAHDASGERAAFRWLVEFVLAQWQRFPDLHVYHYGSYERVRIKTLADRYALFEDETDRMLRAGLFVDLLAVVRESVRVGVESYSIKRLEPLFGFARALPRETTSMHKTRFELALERGRGAAIDQETRDVVASYNADDCHAAHGLRDWLEGVRARAVSDGAHIDRPRIGNGAESERAREANAATAARRDALLADVPPEAEQRTAEQQARFLLAHLLDWHRREDSVKWRDIFARCDAPVDDLRVDSGAIVDLAFVRDHGVPKGGKNPRHEYSFPPQDVRADEGANLFLPTKERLGSVAILDAETGSLFISKQPDFVSVHPSAVIIGEMVPTKSLRDALLTLADAVLSGGVDGTGRYRAARDLLLASPPRLRTGETLATRANETTAEAACRLVLALDGGVLPIQGPPGSGKTTTGAAMIVAALRAGRRVGITGANHSVIRKLVADAVAAARSAGTAVRGIMKVQDISGDLPPGIAETTENTDVVDAIEGGANLVAGTPWLWARSDLHGSVDLLFVDEAGQTSLANVVAAAMAATNVVLLGDPRQLDQPTQAAHPEGTDVSALQHLFGGALTMPRDRGLFLERTWRLPPPICLFTSEVFYESRLEAAPGSEQQRVDGPTSFARAGLYWVPVPHEGNRSSAPEEVDVVEPIVRSLLRTGVTWTNRDGRIARIGSDDILVVAPYNMQVRALRERLRPFSVRVGTVDKFQGQEAPIVICSYATSTPDEAPHGIGFLYSLSRLNVATSRAQCVSILVASPSLFPPHCRTPEHMRHANAFCRYLQLAAHIAPEAIG